MPSATINRKSGHLGYGYTQSNANEKGFHFSSIMKKNIKRFSLAKSSATLRAPQTHKNEWKNAFNASIFLMGFYKIRLRQRDEMIPLEKVNAIQNAFAFFITSGFMSVCCWGTLFKTAHFKYLFPIARSMNKRKPLEMD